MKFETGVTKYLKRQEKAIAKTLRKQSEFIKEEAVKITPIDTGALRNSAIVEDGKDTKYNREDKVVFKIDYAVYVHVDLSIKHPIHHGGRDCQGQAKFLENTMIKYTKHILNKFEKLIEV